MEIEFPAERKKAGKKLGECRTVKVVKIPWDERIPYSEVDIPVEIAKQGDQLPLMLRVYFNNGSVELDTLKETAAQQLSNQSFNISQKTVDLVSSAGSVEVFPLSHFNTVNKMRKVGLYLDEAGQLKKLPPNPRATALANLCGFNDVPMVGDMFIGRCAQIQSTTNGGNSIINEDFTLPELDSNALWLKDIQKHNYEHGIATNKVVMDGGGEKDLSSGNGDGYHWIETNEIMEVNVKIPDEITKIITKDIKVKFTSNSLVVQLKNSTNQVITNSSTSVTTEPNNMITLLEVSKLAGTIRPDECTWSINDRDIDIFMEKTNNKVKWNKLQ